MCGLGVGPRQYRTCAPGGYAILMSQMNFPGTWVTTDGSLVYRVVPKCACSTIGQIMYYAENGEFFDGDIHDAQSGLWKWNQTENQDHIRTAVADEQVMSFTCVRNPYTRILSSFFDKIAGIQRNGKRYRGSLVPMLVKRYGIEIEGEFDQIASFRRFLLFARDTIRFRKPMDPDIHWSAMHGHVGTMIRGGGRYRHIFPTEDFNTGMRKVLEQVELTHPVDLDAIPRFNESADHGPKRAHPVPDYFDDLSTYIVHDIYRKDFQLFKYDLEPGSGGPKREIDPEEVARKLAP